MTHRALAASALLTCLLVGGCTGDPEPQIADPTPSASSVSPSPSVSATEAVDPQQAYRDFIDGYVAAISESLSTGDPQPWLALSDPACENCQNLVEGIDDAYGEGGRVEGALWTIEKASFDRSGELGQVWNVEISMAEERWFDAQGELVKTVPGGVQQLGLAVVDNNGSLLVRELKVLGS